MKLSNKNINKITAIMVFDLDGTLADSSHRFKLDPATGQIDLAHWHENSTAEQIARDQVIEKHLIEYQQACHDPHTLCVIATARSWCTASEIWIRDNLGAYPDFISARRSQTDNRSNHTFKGAFIASLRSLSHVLQSAIVTFYDDTPRNLSEFLQAVPDARLVFVKSNQQH